MIGAFWVLLQWPSRCVYHKCSYHKCGGGLWPQPHLMRCVVSAPNMMVFTLILCQCSHL